MLTGVSRVQIFDVHIIALILFIHVLIRVSLLLFPPSFCPFALIAFHFQFHKCIFIQFPFFAFI